MRKRPDLRTKLTVGMVGLMLGVCFLCTARTLLFFGFGLFPSAPGYRFDWVPTEPPPALVDLTATPESHTPEANGKRGRRVDVISPEKARDLAFAFMEEAHALRTPNRKKWRELGPGEGIYAAPDHYVYGAGDWEVWVFWVEEEGAYGVEGIQNRVGCATIHTEWVVRVSGDGRAVEEQHYEKSGMP
jgi:hypothetical protein